MTDSLPLVPVQVGPCRCPGEPHPDGDVVYLYPTTGLQMGMAIQAALYGSEDGPPRLEAVSKALIEHGIADWTFTNGTKEKLAISPGSIPGALPWLSGGQTVVNELMLLHREAIIGPLAAAALKTRTTKSSRRGRTAVTSTSATPDS